MEITREKHLDHMVKVVPFIVTFYGIQCYVILSIGSSEFTTLSLILMGVLLAFMIGCLITYDLKHRVIIEETKLLISFLGRERIIGLDDIVSIKIGDPGQSFSSLYLKTKKGHVTLFFVDDAEKIKSWIEDKKLNERKAA